jgi:DUF1707 SHOCT-like domain
MESGAVTGEAERERIAWALREAYARGDLSLDEFVERMDRVFAAGSAAQRRDVLPAADAQASAFRLPTVVPPTALDLSLINRHLSPGETVYWAGHPAPGLRFTRDDVLFIPLSALIATVLISWIAVVFGHGVPALFRIAGVVLPLVAVYLLVGRFFFGARRRRRTLYLVTSRRVLRIVQRRRRRDDVSSLYLTAIPNITVRSRGGAVLFGKAPPYESDLPAFLVGGDAAEAGIGFYRLTAPEAVADLVEHLRDREASAPARVVE